MIKYVYITDRKTLYPIYHTIKIDIEKYIKDNKLVVVYNKNKDKIQIGVIQRIVNKKAHILIIKSKNIVHKIDFEQFEVNKLIESNSIVNKLKAGIVIDSLEDYITIVEGLKENNKVLFRGQANEKWGLQPSLFRDIYYINKEIDIYKEYKKYNCNNEKTINTIINMQHEGIPTRLLDWTNNPLNALFFSVSSLNEIHNDSKIFCVNVDNIYSFNSKEYRIIESIIEKDLEINKAYSEDEKKEIVNILKPIALRKKSEFIFIETPFYNDRIKAQQGFFSIFMILNEYYIKLVKEDVLRKILGEEHELINDLTGMDLGSVNIEDLISYISRKSKNRGMSEEELIRIRNEVASWNLLNIKITDIEKNEFKLSDSFIEIIIEASSKKAILNELDNININFKSIYPDIQGFALYTEYKYKKI